MKLVGELKEKVEKTETLEEAKQMKKIDGMELAEPEMEGIAGGKMLRRQWSKLPDKKTIDYNRAYNTVQELILELKNPATSQSRKAEIREILKEGSYEGVSYLLIVQKIDSTVLV